ncbi:hypothetical protein D1007_31555 [Hordeum vulgare]|nr:hypothetical protein D1007_31555 [Hordeum vulgare]
MKAALSAYASGVVHLLLTGMMSSVKKNNNLCFNQASSPSLLLVHFANGNAMTNQHRLRKGKGLERITKLLGTKVPIQIAEGMKRPEKPLHAAKFVSECGLVARSHLPVLPHFKEYKNNATLVEDYIGKVAANFEINTDSETMKKPKEERKGEELSAIDLFKATHNSKKHGFSEPVKIAIKLERSKLQAEVMQEEMAAIKLKAEEYEAARDKELELLRKKSQEQEEKLAHLMVLFGAKAF